jgi:hypothetical protein
MWRRKYKREINLFCSTSNGSNISSFCLLSDQCGGLVSGFLHAFLKFPTGHSLTVNVRNTEQNLQPSLLQNFFNIFCIQGLGKVGPLPVAQSFFFPASPLLPYSQFLLIVHAWRYHEIVHCEIIANS